MKLTKYDILICFIFVIILGLNTFPHLPKRLLTYDETDYAVAASRGIAANYLDKNTTSLFSFVKQGLSDYLLNKHTEISKTVRNSKDVVFYRHFHPPFTVYMGRILTLIGGENEFFFRLSSTVFVLLLIPLVYFLLLILFPQYGRIPSILSSFFISISPVLRQVGILFLPHAIYTFFAAASLFPIVAFLKTSNNKFLYITGALMGFSFLTLEYAWLIVLTFLLSLLLNRKYLRIDKKGFYLSWQIFLSFIITFGIYFILYPAGIIKLGILKEYLFYLYIAVIKSEAWKSLYTLSMFSSLLKDFPVDTIIILFSFLTGLYLLMKRKIEIYFLPFFIYIGTFLIIYTLRTNQGPIYIASCYPPLYIIAGVILTYFYKKISLKRIKIPLLATLLIVLFFSNFMYLRKPVIGNDFVKPAIEFLRNNTDKEDKILVSFGYMPTLSYYLPELDIDMVHLSDTPKYLTEKLENEFTLFVFVGKEDSLIKTALNPVLQNKFTVAQKYTSDKNDVIIFKKTNK